MLYRCKNQSIYQVLVHCFGISYNEVKSADFAGDQVVKMLLR